MDEVISSIPRRRSDLAPHQGNEMLFVMRDQLVTTDVGRLNRNAMTLIMPVPF
jgi:hypothetical protein